MECIPQANHSLPCISRSMLGPRGRSQSMSWTGKRRTTDEGTHWQQQHLLQRVQTKAMQRRRQMSLTLLAWPSQLKYFNYFQFCMEPDQKASQRWQGDSGKTHSQIQATRSTQLQVALETSVSQTQLLHVVIPAGCPLLFSRPNILTAKLTRSMLLVCEFSTIHEFGSSSPPVFMLSPPSLVCPLFLCSC